MNIETDRAVIRNLFNCFPQSFINGENEFIACPKINSYFCLDGINEAELKCKILENLSRPAFKGKYYVTDKANQKVYDYHLCGINEFLGTKFSTDDIELIYTYIGNGVNRPLCVRFIQSGYDMQVIKDHKKEIYGKAN